MPDDPSLEQFDEDMLAKPDEDEASGPEAFSPGSLFNLSRGVSIARDKQIADLMSAVEALLFVSDEPVMPRACRIFSRVGPAG